MKILVLNPMTEQTGNVVRDVLYGCWCKGKRIGGGTVPPFSMLIVTELLRCHGLEADFIDAQAEQISSKGIADIISDYDLLIISTSTMSFREDAEYLLVLKGSNAHLKTMIFGSHPTFMPNYCLAHEGVDIIVRREPEYIIRDVCLAMKNDRDYTAVAGIGYKNEAGEPVLNDFYPHIENLDDLPFPNVDLLPKNIHYFNPIVSRLPYMTTTTSKGCPAKCIFCTAPAFDGYKFRCQSADYVIKELQYFIEKGIREVYFRDDTFFVDKERDHRICRYMIDNKMDLTWIANARVSMIDRETMQLARQAGCHLIKFGIESGSQEILDGMRKGYRIEQAYEVFRWAKETGLKTHAHVMIGNPGETPETLEQTIRYILKLSPTTASFGICTPYPGTKLFERVQQQCPEIGDGSATDLSKLHTEGLFNEYYTSLTAKELSGQVRRAYRRFYLRPFYWCTMLRWNMRSTADIKRLVIAATNLLDFIVRGE